MIELPDAIFFDMDGTILDWQTGEEGSWRSSCETHLDGARTSERMHASIRARRAWFWDDPARGYRGRMDLDAASREIVRMAFSDLGRDDLTVADLIAGDYRAMREEAIAPYPGAIETLEVIRERGIRTALLTNGEARNQRRRVEKHALAQYFDCIVIEGEFGVGKPDERVFRHALSATGCEPGRVWMIGDNLDADIVTPHRLGMYTWWIDAGAAGLPSDAAVRPHRLVASMAELLG